MKKNKYLLIILALLAIIAIVFVVLLTSGKINLNKNNGEKDPVSVVDTNVNNDPIVETEPEPEPDSFLLFQK